jgi:hypothetical protein
MVDAVNYRLRAAEFREIAAQIVDPELAKMYLELAQEYEAMAERAENAGVRGGGSWRPHGTF